MEQVSILFPGSQLTDQNEVASYNNGDALRGHGFGWFTGEFLSIFRIIK
jgi:hypothetical protein